MRNVSVSSFILALAVFSFMGLAGDAWAQATPVTKEPVEFPREAVRAGVDKGEVRVKVIVDASGAVTDVQILESQPPRLFDRAVRSSLARWKFNAGDANRTYETLIEFRR